MTRYITHFEDNEASRSQSIMLEIITILGAYRNHVYLVGGWAPYYLLKLFQKPNDPFQHAGSIDIDLAIDFSQINESQYRSIVSLLSERNYKEKTDRLGRIIPFAFQKEFKGLNILIDFLAGEYGGTGKKHRHQRVQNDFLARKARGIDLLPEHYLTFDLNGILPDGSENTCTIKVADIVSSLSMKGITISERYKEKDAYDIYSLITHYKEGTPSSLKEVMKYISKGLVREGMAGIVEKFKNENSAGPAWAAKFIEPDNVDAARFKQIEVYQSVKPFIEGLKDRV